MEIGESIPDAPVVIIKSIGATEIKTCYLNPDYLANAVVEVTQTGNSLREFGLKIADTIMSSECSLYEPVRLAANEGTNTVGWFYER